MGSFEVPGREFAIKAARFFLPSGVSGPGYLPVRHGVLGIMRHEAPTHLPVLDLGELWVAPGLVDTHIHGWYDEDVMDLDPEGLSRMARALPMAGTTTFLATTLTAPVDELDRACEIVGNHVDAPKAARVAGVHLEGPWFTEEHKGAQNPAYMGDPDFSVFERWMDLAAGRVVKIDIAPERQGTAEFTAKAVALGAVVALGHSSATYAEAKACVDAGATVFIHTYNAMSPLNHRNPGMVGCALSTPQTFAELICDGHHVNPVAAKIAMDAKGRNHVALITDCMRAGGKGNGDYVLGELPVEVRDGAAFLKEGGNLAASILPLCQAVKNVVDWGIATPEEAVAMASVVAAQSVGIADVCGQILPGRDADLCVFTPTLDHAATYVAGELAWER